jgi:hypothetical protein
MPLPTHCRWALAPCPAPVAAQPTHRRLWLYVRELGDKRSFLEGLREQQREQERQQHSCAGTSQAGPADPAPAAGDGSAGEQADPPPPALGPVVVVGAATVLVLLGSLGAEIMLAATPAPVCDARQA